MYIDFIIHKSWIIRQTPIINNNSNNHNSSNTNNHNKTLYGALTRWGYTRLGRSPSQEKSRERRTWEFAALLHFECYLQKLALQFVVVLFENLLLFFGLKILSKWRKWDESTGIRPKKRKPMIPKLSTIQFRLAFKDKGHKSLEYCCFVILYIWHP